MKIITKNLSKFAFFAAGLAVIFRYCLTYGIEHHSNAVIIISSVSYAVSMFIAGKFFGIKGTEQLPIYDVGFRFHLVAYLVHNLVSQVWFFLGFNSTLESVNIINYTAAIWGILLLIHFIFFLKARTKSIDNLNKEDLFD